MEDVKLTENFGLYELTVTSYAQLQALNRMLTSDQIFKLNRLAELLEQVRKIVNVPMKINSGYRCPRLNEAVGSSIVSQHLLCEAADFVPMGMDITDAFREIWKAMKYGNLKLGQLIFETAERQYGDTSWIHISLGEPYRDRARCQQALRMEHGKYRMLNVNPL